MRLFIDLYDLYVYLITKHPRAKGECTRQKAGEDRNNRLFGRKATCTIFKIINGGRNVMKRTHVLHRCWLYLLVLALTFTTGTYFFEETHAEEVDSEKVMQYARPFMHAYTACGMIPAVKASFRTDIFLRSSSFFNPSQVTMTVPPFRFSLSNRPSPGRTGPRRDPSRRRAGRNNLFRARSSPGSNTRPEPRR